MIFFSYLFDCKCPTSYSKWQKKKNPRFSGFKNETETVVDQRKCKPLSFTVNSVLTMGLFAIFIRAILGQKYNHFFHCISELTVTILDINSILQ